MSWYNRSVACVGKGADGSKTGKNVPESYYVVQHVQNKESKYITNTEL